MKNLIKFSKYCYHIVILTAAIFIILPNSCKSQSVVDKEPIVDTLSEWQVFVLALVEVECERNPNLTSSKGAIGPFQITSQFVNEVNRLYGTSFILEDAWDIDKSLTMFEMINDHYNPNRDIDKAIELHNPRAGKWYNKRIKKRMELVRFNEKLREQIVLLYNN